KLRQSEAIDPERGDGKVCRARRHQLRHQFSDTRTELEAVARETELMVDAFGRRARPDHRNVVRHPRLDTRPGTHDRGTTHRREQLPYGLRAFGQLVPVDLGAVLVAVGACEVSAADHHGAVLELLERELA